MRKFISVFSFITISYGLNAQSFTCDAFSVSGLALDTFNVNNTLVNIQMDGNDSVMANYPYVSVVTNCMGDTIATGNMFFFGQIGGTEQGYPVTLIPEDVCLPLNIQFIYGNDIFETDTCWLLYGENDLCSLFSILGVESDTLNSEFTLLNIAMGGEPFDQVNYPHISVLTDCDGDTVATGSIFFFGQLGQTEQGYPVTAFGMDVCFPLTAEFVFGDMSFEDDTCYFTLDGPVSAAGKMRDSELKLFPVPALNELKLTLSQSFIGSSFQVFDAMGKEYLNGIIMANTMSWDVSQWPNGVYVLAINGKDSRTLKWIKNG